MTKWEGWGQKLPQRGQTMSFKLLPTQSHFPKDTEPERKTYYPLLGLLWCLSRSVCSTLACLRASCPTGQGQAHSNPESSYHFPSKVCQRFSVAHGDPFQMVLCWASVRPQNKQSASSHNIIFTQIFRINTSFRCDKHGNILSTVNISQVLLEIILISICLQKLIGKILHVCIQCDSAVPPVFEAGEREESFFMFCYQPGVGTRQIFPNN